MECYRQLKIIRKQNNLTQQQLADALRITRSAYCSYETGRRSPDVDTIGKLASFYNLSVDKFYEELQISTIREECSFESQPDTRYLSQLSKDEVALIAKYRAMNEVDKKEVFDLADSKVESKP